MFNAFRTVTDANGDLTLDLDTVYAVRLTAGKEYTLPKITPESRGHQIELLLLPPTGGAPTLALAPGDTFAYTDGMTGWDPNSISGLILTSDGEGSWWPVLVATKQA